MVEEKRPSGGSFALSVENNDQTNDRPSLPATLVRRTPPNYYVIRDADGQRAELCLFRLLAQKPTSRPHCDALSCAITTNKRWLTSFTRKSLGSFPPP